MLDDAIYYSRREAEERTAAAQSGDRRVRQIHGMLADRYGELAKRALAKLPDREAIAPVERPAYPMSFQIPPRRFR